MTQNDSDWREILISFKQASIERNFVLSIDAFNFSKKTALPVGNDESVLLYLNLFF